ncbi:MAG: tetratricopeptide repeat protein [Bacteroidia bacterium]
MKSLLFRLLFNTCILLSAALPAQDQKKIDSLLKALPLCKEDTNKVHLLTDLSWEISYNSAKDGIAYAEQARKLAEKLQYMPGLAQSYHDLGAIYIDMGDFDKANDFLYRELRLIEAGKTHITAGGCYIELGILYASQSNIPKALHFDSLALALDKKHKNLKTEATTLINMATLFQQMGDYEKAMEINQRALDVNKHLKRIEATGSIYCNMGELCIHLKRYKEALNYITQGLNIYKKENLTYSLPAAYSSMGDYYFHTGDPARSIPYYDSAISCLVKAGQKEQLMNVYGGISEAYEANQDYKNAHIYHKLYSALKDTLFNDNKNKEISKNEMRYEVDKLKMEEDKKDTIAAHERSRMRIIMYAMVLVMVILLVLAFILYRNYILKKKNNHQLEEKNAVIEEKNKSITDSINYAKRIQTAILPPGKTIKELLPESFVLLKPKDIVSGDFYWMGQAAGKVLFSAVDCTGHGVPGALVSVVAYSTLNRCLKEYHLDTPSEILDKLNILVQEVFGQSEDEVKDGMDMSLCSLDRKARMLEYSGANNPLWIIRRLPENGTTTYALEEIKADKQPIGQYDGHKPFTNHVIHLNEGDTIYIFSDGYADQFGGEKGKKFKYKKLQELLLSIQDRTMAEQETMLLHSFKTWQNQLEQVDDVLIIGVRV